MEGECGGDNSTCTGCMDNTACNYDDSASIDGDCEYPGEELDCEGNPLSIKQSIPKEFEISSVYPNPFNPICQLSIVNPKFSLIEISVYNIRGKLVSDIYSGNLSPGFHNFHWNAQNFQSGLYFIKVNYDNTNEVMRVTLIK